MYTVIKRDGRNAEFNISRMPKLLSMPAVRGRKRLDYPEKQSLSVTASAIAHCATAAFLKNRMWL